MKLIVISSEIILLAWFWV